MENKREETSKELEERINKTINNPVVVCEQIYLKVLQLGKARRALEDQARKKAEARARWKKERAKKMIDLRDLKKDEVIKWEGKDLKNLPVTMIKYVAEGMVNDLEGDMYLQDDLYDYLKTTCYNLASEMNGLQSINKYMEDIPENTKR